MSENTNIRYYRMNTNDTLYTIIIRYCEDNCMEDFKLNNGVTYRTISYFGPNNDEIIVKNISEYYNLFLYIIDIFNNDNEYEFNNMIISVEQNENIYNDIACINYISINNYNNINIEISNPDYNNNN